MIEQNMRKQTMREHSMIERNPGAQNNNEQNMIKQLIPYYPQNRCFEQMSNSENNLNWVIKTALGVPDTDIRRLRELREIVDEISDKMIGDKMTEAAGGEMTGAAEYEMTEAAEYEMTGASGGEKAEGFGSEKGSGDDERSTDRWTMYSAMIVHYMSGRPGWRYSRSEVSRFISPEVAALAYDDEMTDLMFTFAETLAEVRDKASFKRTGSIWWGPKAGGTAEECEARIRTLAEEAKPYLEDTELYYEYIMLTDRIFEDSQEQWNALHGKGFDDLDDLFASLPDRMILYKGTAYTILDVKKYREYAGRQQIDDIEFDLYETGVRLELVLHECGTEEAFEVNIRDWHSGRSCMEILRRYDIGIPDQKVRQLLKLM